MPSQHHHAIKAAAGVGKEDYRLGTWASSRSAGQNLMGVSLTCHSPAEKIAVLFTGHDPPDPRVGSSRPSLGFAWRIQHASLPHKS